MQKKNENIKSLNIYFNDTRDVYQEELWVKNRLKLYTQDVNSWK